MNRTQTVAVLAIAAAVVFQLSAAILATLLTHTGEYGAPLPAGMVSFMLMSSGGGDELGTVVDLVVTALAFAVPARRSALALGASTIAGIVVFAAMLQALPNDALLASRIAWWAVAMLPALALGLLPRIEVR